MKDKIKIFLAREWIILIFIIVIGVVFNIAWEYQKNTYCYKTYNDISLLNEQEILLNEFIKKNENFMTFDSNLKKIIHKDDNKLSKIIHICNNDFTKYLGTTYPFDIDTWRITLFIFWGYVLLQILRLIVFTTVKSVNVINQNYIKK